MDGVVLKSTGSWYTILSGDEIIECRIKGKIRMQGLKSTNPIAVGDHVTFEMQPDEKIAVIHEIKDRKNYIIRKATNLSKQTHIIASNIDQALFIATLVLPRTSTGFIDRFLITAEAYQIPVKLIFNKVDLYDPQILNELDEVISIYTKIGYDCLRVSALEESDIKKIKLLLKDKTTLFSGHSGAGKSTLINAIDESFNLKIGEISHAHDKGTHTTTFAEMFPLSFGGFVIDTPGIKEFGMVNMKKEELSHYFKEMREKLNECRFDNCLHENEPGCAIKKAVEKGEIAEFRYLNYLNILNSEELEIKYR